MSIPPTGRAGEPVGPGAMDGGARGGGFELSREDLRRELSRLRREPARLARPLVVISGYRAPQVAASSLARALRGLTGAPAAMVLAVSYPLAGDFESAVATVLRRVMRRFPGPDAHSTAEVDVVGISMGGLVARAAASPGVCTPRRGRRGDRREAGPGGGAVGGGAVHASAEAVIAAPRLSARRVFTLGTPHRGARLAEHVRPDAAARDMRPGSAFLARLDAALARADYELVCYARTRDGWVGARNAAPPGRAPIWVAGPRVLSHLTISTDRRILADLARRLRGERPLAGEATAPPRD